MIAVTGGEWDLPGSGGIALFAQSWLPEGEPRDIVVLAHGFAEHSGRYGNLVERLVPAGYAVHAIDHRGHGRSGGERAMIDSMERVWTDLDRFVDAVRSRHTNARVKLLGHSMGGSIAFGYALRHPEKLSGLILSGPAMGALVSPVQHFILKMIAAIAPRAGTLALSPESVSRDPDVVSAYVADPLVTVGKVPARTAMELLDAARSYPARAEQMTLPLLVQHGGADIPVPPADNAALYAGIGSADKTIRIYDGLYHEIYNEPEHAAVLDDLVAWLEAHPAPA
ncbi:monoacylglycerol lipase [Novosphingobium endophyticum]|uniref:Monoacylglycerol lipase n=1 Tax=Novosphingobium endophyticum TaxID=1955250 RepID=A0A916TT67_9SPHN|nr:alpha/beta hydrolase [Novosphingobium endophyticum]GGC05683.1 monoacylglycerol lipase [Novosphingobium endophyticum]